MNTQNQVFTKPAWANGYEVDVSFDAFLELSEGGEVEITAIYEKTTAPAVDENHNCFDREVCLIDGVRMVHSGGLVEWRDRNWLMSVDADGVRAADGLACQEEGLDA